jgi:hypothetical protein
VIDALDPSAAALLACRPRVAPSGTVHELHVSLAAHGADVAASLCGEVEVRDWFLALEETDAVGAELVVGVGENLSDDRSIAKLVRDGHAVIRRAS